MITEQWSKVSCHGFVLFNLEEFQPILYTIFQIFCIVKDCTTFWSSRILYTYVSVCHHVLTENLRVKRKFFFLVAATGI